MFKRPNTGLSTADVASMAADAVSSFERLPAMNAAICRLSGQPKRARNLPLAAQEMADELVENFGKYKREYDPRCSAGNDQGEAAI